MSHRTVFSIPPIKVGNVSIKSESGHAMTEFVVIALFLTPILLCLPYIAKFYETKHRTTQMVRYMAWEDTVYGSKLSQSIQKPVEQLQSDMVSRFLTSGSQLVTTNASPRTNDELTWDPFLESYTHSSNQPKGIIKLDGFEVHSTNIKNDSLLQKALSASVTPLSLTGFSIDTNGLKQYSMKVPVSFPDWLNLWLGTDTEEMLFDQHMVMYSDSWNTSSDAQQKDMVSSLMPSRAVPARLVTKVLSITSSVMPWTSKWSTLDFGKINVTSAPAVYYRQATR